MDQSPSRGANSHSASVAAGNWKCSYMPHICYLAWEKSLNQKIWIQFQIKVFVWKSNVRNL